MKRSKHYLQKSDYGFVDWEVPIGNQTAKVYRLIKTNGYITRLTAFHNGIANLTARIADLRNAGVEVLCHVCLDDYGREYGRWSIRESDETRLIEGR